MEEKELILTFTRSLKATLDIGGMYSVEHPLFHENIEALVAAIENLLTLSDPITIGFSPSALITGSTSYDDQKMFQSLAHSFHLKKIKSLSFRSGINRDNYMRFLSKRAVQQKRS
jgi:hypothetical protein